MSFSSLLRQVVFFSLSSRKFVHSKVGSHLGFYIFCYLTLIHHGYGKKKMLEFGVVHSADSMIIKL